MESRTKISLFWLELGFSDSEVNRENLNFTRSEKAQVIFSASKFPAPKLELEFIFHLEEVKSFLLFRLALFLHWMIVSCVRLMSTFFSFF